MPYWGALFGRPIRITIPTELASEPAFLAFLGLGAAEFKKIWYFRKRMYQHFSIAKSPNKVRMISAPDARLKFLQRKIADKLTELYRPRNPVHGFVAKRSVKTNALAHLHRRFILNIDLQDFFPTISQKRVGGMLLSLGIAPRVAEIIVRICCNGGHLPQGAPSSPILSNMICFRLDKDLMRFAKEARCIYTRYADDITFSSYQRPTGLFEATPPSAGRLSPELLATSLRRFFQQNGFTINTDKVHYADRNSRRIVTGLKVNELINVDRRYVRNIRAALHSIETLGIRGAEEKFLKAHGGRASLAAHLRGKISFLTHVKGQSDPIVRSVTLRFNRCIPTHPIRVTPTPTEIRDRAVWVVEHDDSQGTTFFLKNVGLVTAAHCVEGFDEVEVFHPSKHANRFKATVRRRDRDRDLAILDHQIPATEYFELDPISSEIQTGTATVAVGYPAWGVGDSLNVRPGVVTSLPVKRAIKLVEVSQKLSQGMSGGPLLEVNNMVAGIIHKGGPGEGRDFAIRTEVLQEWLRSQ